MADFDIQPTVMPTDQYDKLDAYELLSLYMESESGGKVDLKPLFQNISFVEDITKSAMSGSVIIKDAVNLLNTFPISGYEKIHIEFRTPGIGADYTKKVFDVVEVEDKVRGANDRSEIYRIRFVSTSATTDKGVKISKSFSGKISDIASEIYETYIGGQLETQTTLNEQRYVIPRWSPFHALEWLSARAIPAQKSEETNYFFYETLRGHKFVSLGQLVSQQPVIKYFSLPAGVRSPEPGRGKNFARAFSSAKSVRFVKVQQKLKEFMDGAFSSTLYTHDVTTKQWGKFVYNYNEDEQTVRRVAKEKLTKNNDKYVQRPDVSMNLSTKQTGLMGAKYPDAQNHEEWLQRTMSTRSLMDSMKIRIKVSGNSLLEIGDVVEFFLPKASPVQQGTEWYDENYSGKYLITTLRHTITQEGYENTILLSKNGYETALPDQSTFMNTSSTNPGSSSIFGKK